MKTILITGGAGYIGSAATKELIKKDYNVIIVDNLVKGKKELVDNKAKLYISDLVDHKKLEYIFSENKIDAVIHFSAYKAVGESMKDASKYSDNITGTINILKAMVKYDVNKIIYSSSACVYGEPDKIPIDEKEPIKTPINYYGYTKLASEQIIEWFSKIHNINYINLRYFNVAGDANLNYIDPAAENVMPIIMETLTGKREKFMICGDDYDTRDGTCIRDYIDINDLVDAHILALDSDYNGVINLGSSKGVTVKELLDLTMEITGKKINYEIVPRREGDTPVSIASNQKAKDILGWEPKRDIREMIRTTYNAYIYQK